MRKLNIISSLSALTIVLLLTNGSVAANPRPDKTLSFNRDWRFHLGDLPDAKNAGFDDSRWRTMNLPHDWSIEGQFDEKNPAGTGGGALPGGAQKTPPRPRRAARACSTG